MILSQLDEKQRRWVAAAEAQPLGCGGFNKVAAITDLPPGDHPPPTRPGGGGRPLTKKDSTLAADLMKRVVPETAG